MLKAAYGVCKIKVLNHSGGRIVILDIAENRSQMQLNSLNCSYDPFVATSDHNVTKFLVRTLCKMLKVLFFDEMNLDSRTILHISINA